MRRQCADCVHWGQTVYGAPFGRCCKVRGAFTPDVKFMVDDKPPTSLEGQGGGAAWPETWAHAVCADFKARYQPEPVRKSWLRRLMS